VDGGEFANFIVRYRTGVEDLSISLSKQEFMEGVYIFIFKNAKIITELKYKG
jgi:hypothetical protein